MPIREMHRVYVDKLPKYDDGGKLNIYTNTIYILPDKSEWNWNTYLNQFDRYGANTYTASAGYRSDGTNDYQDLSTTNEDGTTTNYTWEFKTRLNQLTNSQLTLNGSELSLTNTFTNAIDGTTSTQTTNLVDIPIYNTNVLYGSIGASAGTVVQSSFSLSDSIDNYSFVEFHYYQTQSQSNYVRRCQKLMVSKGVANVVNLDAPYASETTSLHFTNTQISITGDQVSVISGTTNDSTVTTTGSIGAANYIALLCVIGIY